MNDNPVMVDAGELKGAVESDDLEPGGTPVERVMSDEHLAAACSAAVDSLEIAARLETAGFSSQVVKDSFGFSDVFGLAQTMYDQVPFQTTEAPAAATGRRGNVSDLLRGLLYAVPALLLTGSLHGFSVKMAWWAVPLGLTCGWAIANGVAAIGWTLRGRGETRSDAWLATVSLVVTAAVSYGLGLIARSLFGGTNARVYAAVALAVYIAMSAILLLQGAEVLLVACLIPGLVGTILAHLHGPFSIPPRAGAWTVVLTFLLVVVAAHRTVFSHGWHRPVLSRTDLNRGLQYLLLGATCGTITSVVIGFGAAADARGDAQAMAVWPLLLTLGVMEWQLRSFRACGVEALSTATDLNGFASAATRTFFRCFGIYVAFLSVFSVAALGVGHVKHATLLPLLLGIEGILGIAFFLSLLMESSSRINLALAAWGITLAPLVAALLATLAIDGHIVPVTGLRECLAAGGLAICVLALMARRVLVSPLSF